MMAKQSSLDDVGLELEDEDATDEFEDANTAETTVPPPVQETYGADSPRPGTPIPQKGIAFLHSFLISSLDCILSFPEEAPKCLPWAPKVRQKDLDQFLHYTRYVS